MTHTDALHSCIITHYLHKGISPAFITWCIQCIIQSNVSHIESVCHLDTCSSWYSEDTVRDMSSLHTFKRHTSSSHTFKRHTSSSHTFRHHTSFSHTFKHHTSSSHSFKHHTWSSHTFTHHILCASKCHELYHLNITNCTDLNVTNWVQDECKSQSASTNTSTSHEPCHHLNITKYIHVNVTNCINYMSQTT